MRKWITVGLFCFAGVLQAQDVRVLDNEYPFSEGVYLTRSEFLANNPLPPSRVGRVYSRRLLKRNGVRKKSWDHGAGWDGFADAGLPYASSLTVDSIRVALQGTRLETVIPGHNFFGFHINGRLYLNIAPHLRPPSGQYPVFGRAAFIGRLTVLYVEYLVDEYSHFYTRDEEGFLVREGGQFETIRTLVIYDLVNDRHMIVNERSFARLIEDDPELLERYRSDKKRKKHIPYYADQYNQRNPLRIR